jgi:uncharacterized LabA/DUF88 family protein
MQQKPIAYAFIDSQNLNIGVRNQGWKLDFRKFRRYLRDKYNVSKAYLFIGKIKGNHKLYNYLRSSGYELIFKEVIIGKHGVKGNVDAELVLHAVDLQFEYNKAIIVSGDGDFKCLLDYLNKKDKLQKVIIPNSKKYSHLLRKFKAKSLFVNSIKSTVESK